MGDTIFLDISKKTILFVTIVLLMVIAFFIGFSSGFITGYFFNPKKIQQIEQKNGDYHFEKRLGKSLARHA